MGVYISSLARSDTMRAQALKVQRELNVAQEESTTGRIADLGLAKGGAVGRSVDLRSELTRIDTLISTNSVVTLRLETTQVGLSALQETTENLQDIAYAATGSNGRAALADAARAAIGQMTGILNRTIGGQPVYAGQNTDSLPLTDYFSSPAGPAKNAVDAAFVAAFGFTQTDPAVATITAAQLKTFVEGPFAALFDEAAWKATWSTASDERMVNRISPEVTTETSVTANEAAIRKTAAALVMAADLGAAGLNDNAFTQLRTLTQNAVGEAASGLVAIQTRVGAIQNRVTAATETMQASKATINVAINDVEAVDPYEAATRVTDLMRRLESSYALTARFQKLSLLEYL